MSEQPTKTMEEILAEVAFRKAQGSAQRLTSNPLPEGTRVRLSAEAHARLAKSHNRGRCRPEDRIGKVVGFDERQGRIKVEWSRPRPHIEPLALMFLEVVA